MPTNPTYSTGTATVVAGSLTVTGTGTLWLTNGLRAGDIFEQRGLSVSIAAVVSNTQLTLVQGWPGLSAAGAYEIRETADSVRVLAATRQLIEQLSGGNILALSGLASASNLLPYFTGPGAAGVTPISPVARDVLAQNTVAQMRAALGLQGYAGAGIRVLGTRPNIAALPADGNAIGDAWLVNGTVQIWTGALPWVNAGAIVGPPGADGVQVYSSRAAASAGAPNLSTSIAFLWNRTGSGVELRQRNLTTNDPLFESGDRWGVVIRLDNLGRVWHTTDNVLSTQTPPDGTDQIAVATNTGMFWYRRLAAAPGTVNPAIHQQTANGTWWLLVEDSAAIRASIANALTLSANSGFPAVSGIGGTANAITGLFPYGNGTSLQAGNRLSLVPALSNTGAVTLNNIQIRTESGQFLTGGELVPGRMIFLERDASVNYLKIVGGGGSAQSDFAPLIARLTAIETELDAPIETVAGEDSRAIITDASGNAMMIWKPGVSGGFDMPLADSLMDTIGEYLGTTGGGTGPDPELSNSEIQVIGVNGQSLSVGGDFNPSDYPPSAVQRDALIAKMRPGAALLLQGTVRGDNVPILTLDMPRSQGYNETVPATGFGPANPGQQTVTAAWPLANAINEYRKDLGLPMVPIASQCHGVSGQLIENIDNDPNTGTAGYLTIWNNLRYYHQQARARAIAEGKRVSVPWHLWVHGTSAAGYAEGSYLSQLWNYKDDMQELMQTLGLTGPARMLISQAGGNTNITNAGNQWHVVDEQLQFCEAGGGVLTTPEYAYEIFDNNVHPDAHALVQIGEVAARAAAEIEAGKIWTIGRPKVQLMGSTMILNFDTLRPGEYLKRHDPARYGGQGIDDYLGFEPVGTTFTDMTIRGQTIAFTCAAPPTGIRYAYQRQDVRSFAGNRWNAHRGLLRTSDEWASKLLDNVMLYRWINAFKIAF